MSDLKPGLGLRPTVTLAQAITPKLIQMFHLFQLPYDRFLEEIKTQTQENPLLEVARQDGLIEYLAGSGYPYMARPPVLDGAKIAPEISGEHVNLNDYLSYQLDLEYLDETDKAVADKIMSRIDQRGYVSDYFPLRHEITKELGVSRQKIDQILRLIQSFEPAGVGARSLSECLLIQLREHRFEDPAQAKDLELLISEYLAPLAAKKFAEVSRKTGLDEDSLRQALNFIEKNLSADPGAGFSAGREAAVASPSFLLEFAPDGDLRLTNLEEKWGPIINLNQNYLKMLDDPKTDEETRKFIREKLAAAQEVVKNIVRRRQSIQRLVEEICRSQKDFFKQGIHWLKPLPQKDLARKLDLTASIVSRLAANKYLQTPQGIIPFKYLCPLDFHGFAPARIQAQIADLIKEDPGRSDADLTLILNDYGIPIKRRTVTKYRLRLRIPSSRQRS